MAFGRYTDKLPRFRLGLTRVVRSAVIYRIADRLSPNNTTDVQDGRVQMCRHAIHE